MSALVRVYQRLPAAIRSGHSVSVRSAANTKLCCFTLPAGWRTTGTRHFGSSRWLRDEATVVPTETTKQPILPSERKIPHDFAKTLPIVCPGCGALSQTVAEDTPGYYSPKKRNTKPSKAHKERENDLFQQAMARLSASKDATTDIKLPIASESEPLETQQSLICDRCHDLLHQSKGNSILHPSMQSIQSIIEASPHKHNHIYHVLDAADFPMSLIPNLISALRLPRLRTQNRRSKSRNYINGRVADVSFIITRSDLLAPQKEMVDKMMPYLQEVLRDALGRSGKNLRLGNVRCVSAKRGWWTPQVKQEIWKRGGAGWVVGKVNVGKSALFEVVFPKGKDHVAEEEALRARRRREISAPAVGEEDISEDQDEREVSVAIPEPSDTLPEDINASPEHQDPVLADINSTLMDDVMPAIARDADSEEATTDSKEIDEEDLEWDDDEDMSLLPPAQPETKYPQMPIVSALPGTTASPIRIPYGNGKGELIDLPGVARSSLETHVEPEHRQSLVMKSRVVPEQYTIKPGQSLLLGGIIRITPKTDDLIFLAYPFTPLKAHATSTSKALAIQTGVQEDGTPYLGTVENIATEKAKGRMRSAGTFKLEWDVTKKRAGPVTDKTAGKQKAENLPYIVYGGDVLIEGVGWVEIVCQVRRRRESLITDALSSELGLDGTNDPRPEIEVFTPKGKFIGIRQPMNAWLTGGPKKVAKHAQRSRPRMTISMHKRREGGRKGGQLANATPG